MATSMPLIQALWLLLFCSVCGRAAAATSTEPKQFRVGQNVNTTSGLVVGHRAQNATQVSEYLGIPYAHPPVGNLRFAPPVPWRSNTTIQAKNYGHDCPSSSAKLSTSIQPPSLYNILAQLGQVGDDQQEDCLYLNVWSKPQTGSAKKPVLVWLYGGGFQIGGTNTTVYNGQFWADAEDVVFVSLNYRLNIFGFPGAPNLEQNAALLDQRLAFEWVRDNIEAFGGDPSRIVIFGQSTGGASVDLYNYAYTHDPIIAGSISESGTAISFGNVKPETAATRWFNVSSKLGCNSTNANDVLACMRSPNITMTSILAAESDPSASVTESGMFNPTIDNKTVFANYTDLALHKRFIHKPYIFGNNYYEAGLFSLLAIAAGENVTQDTWALFDAGQFTCPTTTAATFRADVAHVPTWRYIYKAEFPNEVFPTSMGVAWHGAELPPMFGTSEALTKQDSTWQERAMGAYMRGAWAAFAHDPVHGLDVYGWRRYSNATDSFMQLGFDNTSSTTFSVFPSYNSTAAYSFLCPHFPFAGSPNI